MLQPNDSEDFLHRKNNKLLVGAVTLVVVDFYKCVAYLQYLPGKNVASLTFSLCYLSRLWHYSCYIVSA